MEIPLESWGRDVFLGYRSHFDFFAWPAPVYFWGRAHKRHGIISDHPARAGLAHARGHGRNDRLRAADFKTFASASPGNSDLADLAYFLAVASATLYANFVRISSGI